MKFSTRSRYGLRMMYELALSYGDGPVFLKDIALRQDMSEKYLSKLIIPLKGARLVNSSRGAHGGYTLARPPEEITAWEIVHILEGDISPVECVKDGGICDRTADCPTRDLWCRLDDAITSVLKGITLGSLVRSGHDRRGGDFCI